MKLKRRHFILGAVGATAGLVVAWAAAPVRQRLTTDKPLPPMADRHALNGWVKIGADNSVSVVVASAEMGQGIHTGLAMILADELDADWAAVTVEAATDDRIYNNLTAIAEALPFDPNEHSPLERSTRHLFARVLREVRGADGTGGSSSMADKWLPMREAGASARAMLLSAAANRWRVGPSECTTDRSRVLHPSGRSASYGELVLEASTLDVPRSVPLKSPRQFKLIGKPVRRIESAAKINGTAVFAIDVDAPGMLYAFVKMCPTLGGSVKTFDASKARSLPGVQEVLVVEPVPAGLAGMGMTSGGVAVVASTPYEALSALEQVQVEWNEGPAQGLSSSIAAADLVTSLNIGKAHQHVNRGNVHDAIAAAKSTVRADYAVPLLAHAAMEPLSCTVLFDAGKATVWGSTQSTGQPKAAVAKALQIDSSAVNFRRVLLGGSFGRRAFKDFVVQAALLAKRLPGRPVKLMWTREQDMTHDYYRPMYAARCEASLNEQGSLTGLRMTTSGSSLGAPAVFDGAVKGSADMPYRISNLQVAHVTVEATVTLGIWRSVGHSQNVFFLESFLDEVAAASGKDPFDLRLSLLQGLDRHKNVLRRLRELSNWKESGFQAEDGTLRARGMALAQCFGSVIAQVAEISLTPQGELRVHKVFCVIDCGFAVNPSLVRQQVEGGALYGLTAALYGEITVDRGRVRQTNFHDYRPLRMSACPEFVVDIVSSSDTPTGVGEAATPVIAPTVANALFALKGRRVRALPFKVT